MKTTIKKKAFLEALKMTAGIIAPACRSAGINRQTVYNWLNADEKFKAQYEEILEAQIDRVESILLEKVFKKKETMAVMYYLNGKGKKRGYGKGAETEQPINVTFERVE